jgi:hypothetical protein
MLIWLAILITVVFGVAGVRVNPNLLALTHLMRLIAVRRANGGMRRPR